MIVDCCFRPFRRRQTLLALRQAQRGADPGPGAFGLRHVTARTRLEPQTAWWNIPDRRICAVLVCRNSIPAAVPNERLGARCEGAASTRLLSNARMSLIRQDSACAESCEDDMPSPARA